MNLLELLKEVLEEIFEGESVNEIGLDSEKMKPYYYETVVDDADNRVYQFETDSGINYVVDLHIREEEYNSPYKGEITLSISFGTYEAGNYQGIDYDATTNKGELYRVMNTIADIIKKDLSRPDASNIRFIAFNPSKRTQANAKTGKVKDMDVASNSRAKLYLKYIISRLPNAKEIKNHPLYGVFIQIKDYDELA